MYFLEADTPPPAYSPSEDVKQGQVDENAMDTCNNIPTLPTAIPVQYQVSEF